MNLRPCLYNHVVDGYKHAQEEAPASHGSEYEWNFLKWMEKIHDFQWPGLWWEAGSDAEIGDNLSKIQISRIQGFGERVDIQASQGS